MSSAAGEARIAGAVPDAWLEGLTVFVLATGLCGLALALAGWFTALAALGLGIAISVAWCWRLRVTVAAETEDARGSPTPTLRWRHVLPVLLVALLFRLPPSAHVQGGQDQGVYTNVAAQIVRTGGIAVDDPAWARLAKTSARAGYIADNYTDPFLPGVYTIPGETPRFVFQFYHLFPVWMAIFGGLFGIGAAAWGLSFLSLFSVLFFQRLALQLGGSERVALGAGLLLAVNPLHAYFSRLPLTEIPTLAFSLAGFTWLAQYAQAAAPARRTRWLLVSAAAFACLFLTRVSGFLYLPILFALAWLPPLLDQDSVRARAIARWAYATIALYGLSIAYGLVWSHPYVVQVHEQLFALALGPRWPIVLAAAVSASIVGSLALARMARADTAAPRLRALVLRGEALLGPALLLVLAVGAWKLWQFGFSPRYLHANWLAPFPGVAGQGWMSVARGSLVVAAMYLCPLAAAAWIVLAQARWPTPGGRLLPAFVLCFALYSALVNWIVPYQPYYARYLASELVPYVLLFTSCCVAWIDRPRARRLLVAVLLASGAWAAALSAAQLGRVENAGAFASIGRLAGILGKDDVLLIDTSAGQGFEPKEIKMSLAYSFGRNVVSAGSARLADVGFLDGVAGAYDTVYLASASSVAPPGFVRVGSVRLRAGGFVRGPWPPTRYGAVLDAPVQLYRLGAIAFDPGRHADIDAARDARVLSQVGHRVPGRGLVADGRVGYLAYGPYLALPAGTYWLEVRGADPHPGDRFDVAMSAGASVLATGQALVPARGGLVGAFGFRVPAPGATDIEIRAQVPAASTLSLRGYSLHRLR